MLIRKRSEEEDLLKRFIDAILPLKSDERRVKKKK